ncbi:MAG: hypothetical protein JWQ87_2264 [Candidatus Sulfotelmatobacter sp.]|nr:hypothetical protein [Candidatus Sulfotelmatobacter sp.]
MARFAIYRHGEVAIGINAERSSSRRARCTRKLNYGIP